MLAVNEARAKLGYLRDTPDNRRVVTTTMLRAFKDHGLRAFDVSRNLPLAEELFFIPTEAQLEQNALKACRAACERRNAAAQVRTSGAGLLCGTWRWLFGGREADPPPLVG